MSDPQEPRWLDITHDPGAEHEFRMRELETAHEYSLRLLDGELMDRQRDREHQKTTITNAGILVAFLSFLLASGICYALYLNKDQLIMEFLKAILFLVTGGVGGYSLKLVRDKTEASKQ
jgi:hypothetical protein